MSAGKCAALVMTLSLAVAGPLSAQDVNTTTGGTDAWVGGALGVGGSGGLGGYTDPGYAGFGQVFSAPSGAPVLDAFTFYLADFAVPPVSPDLFGYRAFLGTWDGSTVTSILWEGQDRENETSPAVYYSWEPLSAYRPTSFSPAVSLTPGETYLAFLFPSLRGSVVAGGYDLDVMAMRERLYSPAGTSDGQGGAVMAAALGTSDPVPTPSHWIPYTDHDVAFVATFSDAAVVPEPATLILFATGLLGLGGVALTRRDRDERGGD